jgi:hypothetical protein
LATFSPSRKATSSATHFQAAATSARLHLAIP